MESFRVPFETTSIDLASFLGCAGFPLTVERNQGGHNAMFSFMSSQEMINAIIAYESGATLPAKQLLNTRSRLYREASEVVKRGR